MQDEQKPQNEYVTLVNIGSGDRSRNTAEKLMNLSDPHILKVWKFFGEYDLGINFQAPDLKTAEVFINDHVRGVEGVLSTSTLSSIGQRSPK